MNWFSKRSKEASTWGGVGMLIASLGTIFKADEAPQVAAAVEQAGQAFASGMPWWQAAVLGVAGAAMAFKSDGDRGW